MILSDSTIQQLLDSGEIRILPALDRRDIRPTGIRLHLNDELLIPTPGQTIDFRAPADAHYDAVPLTDAGHLLRPGAFVLASTVERIGTSPLLVGHLEGRSTLARLGLSVHCTSGLIDGNHDEPQSIVLEIANNASLDLILARGMPIAMLAFSRLSEPIRQRSQEQYRGQMGVCPPNLRLDPRLKR